MGCGPDRFIALKGLSALLSMWNRPSDAELSRMPRLYETENVPLSDKIIHQHYFIGGSDWYMAEYDPNDRLFFGYAVLNNDHEMAE